MFDIDKFMKANRACLIAPAGYGKTHTIIECLKHSTSRQLVLTHTHAGVAALKSKMSAANIPASRYELSTISAIAQRLSLFFTRPDQVLNGGARNTYFFSWTLSRAKALLGCDFLKRVFASSYGGIIVDEYQDCSVAQHELILSMAESLPLHVLGDPMQGIFCFTGQPIVDFEKHLAGFDKYELDIPYRWKDSNPALGDEIALLRTDLQKGTTIDFSKFNVIQYEQVPMADCQSKLSKMCYHLMKEGTTVIIVSDSMKRPTRASVARMFGGRCSILEAIDDKEFYAQAASVDGLTTSNAMAVLYVIATSLFPKTGVEVWLNNKGLIRKRSDEDKKAMRHLEASVMKLKEHPSPHCFGACLSSLHDLPNVTLLSHEKYDSLQSAIRLADKGGVSVTNAMIKERDVVRSVGRRIRGFAVGTTLLTKGLEFDNVVVLEMGRRFDLKDAIDRRHFYVAISRACKNAFILSVE